jgi:DnaK suppressor protein
MDAATRDRIEANLRARRAALVGEGDLEIAAEMDTARKVDDDAAPLDEMAKVIASNRNRAHAEELEQIDAALARLVDEPEEFGVCEACDEPIALRRVELMPWVRLCLECQETNEADRPGGRRHITDYR